MKPLISVIVPIYNVEKYLRRCVESILSQTYSETEIILVDDGSTDSCGEICDSYAADYNNIKVIHKKNGGLGFARNSGFEISTGELIMFVDSDDFLSDDAIELLYNRIVCDGSDMAIGKHTDIYEDSSTNGAFCGWMTDSVISKEIVFERMSQTPFFAVSAWGKMYKRELLEGISYPSLKCAEDLWVFPLIIDRCKLISVVNKTIYYYFQRSDSIIHKKSEIIKHDELDATLNTVKILLKKGFEKSAFVWYERAICKAMFFNDKKIALKLFDKYFSSVEKRMLLKGVGFKTQIKWFSLYLPFYKKS